MSRKGHLQSDRTAQCCPCRAWQHRCWSTFPPFLLWKPFPCRQTALETLGPPRALQVQNRCPCCHPSLNPWNGGWAQEGCRGSDMALNTKPAAVLRSESNCFMEILGLVH